MNAIKSVVTGFQWIQNCITLLSNIASKAGYIRFVWYRVLSMVKHYGDNVKGNKKHYKPGATSIEGFLPLCHSDVIWYSVRWEI